MKNGRLYRSIGLCCAFLFAGLFAPSVWAGGGPENVFLVVNPQNESSLAVANCYIRLRHIPPSNVFYLPWDPDSPGVMVNDFRTQFLKPIFKAISDRRLASQIDYVIYSSGFPAAVYLDTDIEKFKAKPAGFKVIEIPLKNAPKNIQVSTAPTADQWKTPPTGIKVIGVSPECTPRGSLSGMTYLWPWVMQNSPDYLTWQCNRYMRLPIDAQKDRPSLGFRSSLQFAPEGRVVEKDGASYMLSAMLGVTYGRGNTVPEILNYLERSAQADGTHPRGTIYFMKNDNVRSLVRDSTFPETVQALEKLGVSAQIVKGTIPLDRGDVQGVCMGTEVFNWKASGSTILPGALCEHFTSFGGELDKNAKQTCLVEFLRYGAAGSSGTVIEPYAVWQKFPLPQIQVHYTRGCTLAEAYYQSVFGPYQLLVVGDPLCRPWANIPKVEVKGIKDGVVKGELVLTPSATLAEGGNIDHFELFVNGVRTMKCKPGETFKLDTAQLSDGSQELRVVAVESSLIQSQGRAIFRMNTGNHGRKIEVSGVPTNPLRRGEKLKLEVKSPGSLGIAIMQNSRIAGRIAGEQGTVEIPAHELGAGKVQLQAVGLGKSGPQSNALSTPFDIEVDLK